MIEPDIFTVLAGLPWPTRPVVIEIGAATGSDSGRIMDALKFRAGEYYAIEPEPANLPRLRAQPCLHTPYCQVLGLAVGHKTRRAVFHQSTSDPHPATGQTHTESGSVKRPVKHLEVHPWCRFETIVEVPMTTLDDLARVFSIGAVDLIWCDVQGAEDWVIAGAQSVLARTRYFYTEHSDQELYEGQIDASAMLQRLPGHWIVRVKWPNDILFERTCELDKDEKEAYGQVVCVANGQQSSG